MNKRLVPLSNALARVCRKLADWFEVLHNHLNRCPNCGRSFYYGKGCTEAYRRVEAEFGPYASRTEAERAKLRRLQGLG
ncbi:MAG: hypothetical protein GY906_38545 [bacterium]|nr:hypothetical protein [bacterium]